MSRAKDNRKFSAYYCCASAYNKALLRASIDLLPEDVNLYCLT